METQVKDGELLGVSLLPPALVDEQSASDAAATTLKGTAASEKAVAADASTATTLGGLAKMESSIMANFENLLIKFMGGGSGSKPPPENSALPVPVDQTALANPDAVAPPPEGFVAVTAVTMPVGVAQHLGNIRR